MASADIDPSEYEPKTSVRSEKERSRLRAIFEADRKAEAEQLRREAEAEAQRLAAEKTAWESLPYPARLTRTRCTVCHVAASYENQNHTYLGWWLVVLRMEHFNGVALGSGEQAVIAAHLAETKPPDGAAALQEYLATLAILALTALAAWIIVRAGLRRMRERG